MSLTTNRGATRTGAVSNTGASSEELDHLADEIGEFIKYWGFKRIHGQIWTHLYLCEHAMDAGELIRRLGVSKALISMSLTDLLSYDVIKRAGKSSAGTQLYEANRDVVRVILKVLEEREFKLISKIHQAFDRLASLPEDTQQQNGINAKNVASLGKLVSTAEGCLSGMLKLGTVDYNMWRKLNGSA